MPSQGPLGMLFAGAITGVLFTTSVAAQGKDDELFDRFNLALEGSLVKLSTTIRLDSKTLGIGTKLDFESDGGLADSEVVGSGSFEWQFKRRHGLRGWWQRVDRDESTQILEEIQFGDTVFPIDTLVTFAFDEEEYGLGYLYYFTRKPHLALGAGGGLRTLKIGAGLSSTGGGLSDDGDFTGPLPFGTFQLRWRFDPRWRLVSEFGIFAIEIGDYSGSQYLLDGYVEYLAWKHLSFGAGWRGGYVDVEVDTSSFSGKAEIDSSALRGYARVRF